MGGREAHFPCLAYNAFIKHGKSSAWCRSHALSFRAMSRAVSIRSQLKKYMHRFHLPIESCDGDACRLRKCLVTGYWRNSAQWCVDGTYISTHGKIVRPSSIFLCAHKHPPVADFGRTSKLCLVYAETQVWLGHLPRNGRDKEKAVS